MAESKSKLAESFSEKDVKSPSLIERAKEEVEVILQANGSPVHHKETHGLRSSIDENTPLDDVKAPNVFERAKEEIEALVQTIHHKEKFDTDVSFKAENLGSLVGKESVAETSPLHPHKETHGMRSDIDEDTAINDVRGPGVLERAKEELEALVQTIHSKKESSEHLSSPREDGGFRLCIARGLEKFCAPWRIWKNANRPRRQQVTVLLKLYSHRGSLIVVCEERDATVRCGRGIIDMGLHEKQAVSIFLKCPHAGCLANPGITCH